jgi:hypothetical protein
VLQGRGFGDDSRPNNRLLAKLGHDMLQEPAA